MQNKPTEKANKDSIGHEFQNIYRDLGKTEAKTYLDNTIDKGKKTRAEFEARFLRAKGSEAGWFGPVDYRLADNDYVYIIKYKKYIDYKIIEECMLGRARILYAKKENFEEIEKICGMILSTHKNHKALTLLGFAYEDLKNDYKTASNYYIASFFKGSKSALAYYSYAKYKCGKYIIGSISLILYYILYPFLSLFDRSKYGLF